MYQNLGGAKNSIRKIVEKMFLAQGVPHAKKSQVPAGGDRHSPAQSGSLPHVTTDVNNILIQWCWSVDHLLDKEFA